MKRILTSIKFFIPFMRSLFDSNIANASNYYSNSKINKICSYKPSQKSNHVMSPTLLLSYVVKCLTIAFSGIPVNRILQGVTL